MDQKMISGEWDSLTYEQKNQALFERQKHTLEEFLEHGAISKQQYEKSLHGNRVGTHWNALGIAYLCCVCSPEQIYQGPD